MSLVRLQYVFVGEFRRVIDERHLTMSDLARDIGISRQRLSSVVAGFKPISVRLRQKVLSHPKLKGVPERRLWKLLLGPDQDPSAAVFQLDQIGRLLDEYSMPTGVDADPSPLARVRFALDELRAQERHVEALEGMLSPEALLFVGRKMGK